MRKKIYYLMLAFLIMGAASVNAQVAIGTTEDPRSGALLDLKSTTKGLLLPQVHLEDVGEFQLSDEDASALEGMMIYNTNVNVVGGSGTGIYVWDGSTWLKAVESGGGGGTVGVPVTSVTISASTPDELNAGVTTVIAAGIAPDNASNKMVIWTVEYGTGEMNGTAAIDPLSGAFTGLTPGKVTVRATAMDGSGQSDSKVIEIKPVFVATITISGSESVGVGNFINLTATILPSNATNPSVEWTVANGTGRANIDAGRGLLYGVAAGTVTVTATSIDGGNVSDTHEVTVVNAAIPVTSIEIMGATSVNVDAYLQLTVDVLPADATNPSVAWNVIDGTGTAEINPSTGLLKGLTAGTVTVVAHAVDGSSMSDTHSINVTAVTNSDGSANMQIGNHIYKTYTYVYADQTTKTWMVENSYEGTASAMYYSNNTGNFNGYYYTHAQAAQTNNACPDGWHLPTADEWVHMANWVNSNKSHEGAAWWITSAGNAFAGIRLSNGTWGNWGSYGYWWSAVSNQNYNGSAGGMGGPSTSAGSWLSVRCVKN